jgi:predicted protein tyrosine phosphatase
MIWRDSEDFNVKSCGTSPASRVKISEKLIRWAEVILVMEKRHKSIILEQFSEDLRHKDIRVLFIPDDYELMNETLIELLSQYVLKNIQ